jgi:hypothetical protein
MSRYLGLTHADENTTFWELAASIPQDLNVQIDY